MHSRKGWVTILPRVAFSNRLLALKFLAILFAIASPHGLCAQSPTLSPHALAQRIDSRYNHLHALRAAFTETYNGLGVRRSESGTLTLLKPGRMRWDYTSPAGKIFLLDGKFAWFYARGDAQVQRIPSRDLDDLRSPLRFLLGHTELEKELLNLRLAPAPSGQFTLTGQPKGQGNKPDQRVTRLALTVTPDGTITAIEIEETDGALTRFTFSGETDNPTIPAVQFHFTPPPGIPVVDATAPV
jgi:outer membrane lipoprotein carrier protein